jgi:hypothetical protein
MHVFINGYQLNKKDEITEIMTIKGESTAKQTLPDHILKDDPPLK